MYVATEWTNRLPKEWKRANTIPIYKSGNRYESLNYRFVSLTSIIYQLQETIANNQWMEYLEGNILTDKQLVFVKGDCV